MADRTATDIMVAAPRLPGRDETLIGSAWHYKCGGKGGNQAVACARQGAQVALFGRVGDDGYGHTLRAGLDADGIDHSGVQTDTDTTTGVAAITVEATGQNRIVVVPGANGRSSRASWVCWRWLSASGPCRQKARTLGTRASSSTPRQG